MDITIGAIGSQGETGATGPQGDPANLSDYSGDITPGEDNVYGVHCVQD